MRHRSLPILRPLVLAAALPFVALSCLAAFAREPGAVHAAAPAAACVSRGDVALLEPAGEPGPAAAAATPRVVGDLRADPFGSR